VSFHERSSWALWNEGLVNRRANGSAQFTPIAGGAADYGLLYALTSFNDTKNNRRVQWGWAPEDLVADGGLFSATQQGFQGSHALPRELYVQTTDRVVNTESVDLGALGPSQVTQNQDGTYTARTLGIRPLVGVVTGLRNGSTQHSFPGGTFKKTTMLMTNGSTHMELSATVSSCTGACGLCVGVSPDGDEATTIYYEPSNNTLVVDRSKSSLIDGFNNASVVGYFYPYTIAPPYGAYGSYGNATTEPLVWDVFLDGSLLEVFINGRFALTTRIYPSKESSNGIAIFVGDGAEMVVESADMWADLYNVFPGRPLNSSSPLLYDNSVETNNYTWWTGE